MQEKTVSLNERNYRLEVPNPSHEDEYTRLMDRWEALESNIQPELLRRGNASYAKWLAWCEDDRTTGSMLSTGVPCTLHFLIADSGEIIGAMVINHSRTHRGHLHAGIAPWHRGKGYGTLMLKLALDICRSWGYSEVEIVPYKDNSHAIQTILKNGGILIEEFCENDRQSVRYVIKLQKSESI